MRLKENVLDKLVDYEYLNYISSTNTELSQIKGPNEYIHISHIDGPHPIHFVYSGENRDESLKNIDALKLPKRHSQNVGEKVFLQYRSILKSLNPNEEFSSVLEICRKEHQ